MATGGPGTGEKCSECGYMTIHGEGCSMATIGAGCDGGAAPGDWPTGINYDIQRIDGELTWIPIWQDGERALTISEAVAEGKLKPEEYERLTGKPWVAIRPDDMQPPEIQDGFITVNHGWPCCPHRYRLVAELPASYAPPARPPEEP